MADRLVYRPVDSCIQFIFQLESTHIVTIEGLGGEAAPSTCNESMIDCHGSQCGFCTPGFLLDLAESIRRKKFLGPSRRIARGDVDGELASRTASARAASSPAADRSSSISSRKRRSPTRASRDRWSSTHRRRTRPRFKRVVAEMLGVGQHEVVCVCKRMGGAFGGKESQAAIPAMLAALVGAQDGPAGARHLQQR